MPARTRSASGDRRTPVLCRAAGSASSLPNGGSNASAYPPPSSRFASAYGCSFVILGFRGSVPPPLPSAAPRVTHGPFPPPRLCCPQRHRYYGPIRQTRAREPFSLLAYTVRPAVHGRSRRGASPSQLCVVCLPLVPLPIRRRDSPTSLARLSVGGNSLRPRGPGSAPSCSPALTSARGTHYVAAAFA
jgi:hypothetical protein